MLYCPLSMKLRVFRGTLPFHYPFTISGGRTKEVQETLIVSLSEDEVSGYGEAPVINYYQINLNDLAAKALQFKAEIESFPSQNPYAFNELLIDLFPADSFLRCALDCAFWDLLVRRAGTSIAHLAQLTLPAKIACDYTLGIDTSEKMLLKMQALPWPVYKIKVGFEGDANLFNHLCLHTDAMFRLDANAAWTQKEALNFIQRIDTGRIEFIEQPLKRELLSEMEELTKSTKMLFIADEDFRTLDDLNNCLGSFGGINIKLTKCGGITPALEIIREARKHGLKIMLGNMNESTIGTWSLLQLAGEADFTDADGPLLLNGDYAGGLIYEHGFVHIPPKADRIVIKQNSMQEIKS